MSKKNIYQKLHSACIEAGSVKKAEKVKGMHFNPLLHDAVQETATQSLLNNGLYPTCSYLTEITDKNMVMVVCTMKVHDVDDPTQFVLVDGCSAMGGLDKFGTGQAMSYSRKYAFLNLLNLKTGIKDEDGYEAKPFKQNSVEQSAEPTYMDDNIDVEKIKNELKNANSLKELGTAKNKHRDSVHFLLKNNLRSYRQITDIAESRELQLNNGQQ